MNGPAVLFDLDDTLVDTSELFALRKSRRWSECYRNLSKTSLYPGTMDAIALLREDDIPIGIVTTSISNYAEKVLKFHGIPYDALVAYHDCRGRQKPNPAPVMLCLERLGCEAERSLGIGDAANDALAYARANVVAWGAGWSSKIEQDAEWDKIILTPKEILTYFKSN